MNDEKLKRAQELSETIKVLKEEISRWEMADRFEMGNRITLKYNGNHNCNVMVGNIPFDITKTLTLDVLRKELLKAEQEYEAI